MARQLSQFCFLGLFANNTKPRRDALGFRTKNRPDTVCVRLQALIRAFFYSLRRPAAEMDTVFKPARIGHIIE